MISADEKKIQEFIRRGVETVLPSPEFVKEKLLSGNKLRVYLGIDPTGPSLHIGHAIAIKKLAQLQQLGHQIILLMGDFTARIGDPTDKTATRKMLTEQEVANNLKSYKSQASKIISFDGDNPAEIKFNSEWLDKMNFKDVIALASQMTVQRMLERDMFQERIKEGKPIYIHEFLYPLMQGQDSVAMMVDGEIGGNDQVFNMLVGRDLLKEHGKDKFIVSVKLLADSSGKKMGKSEGNMITLADSPNDMFGKIMAWPDERIIPGLELCTNVSEESIHQIKDFLQQGENPMQYKKQLAKEIVALYHDRTSSESAEDNWEKTFSEGGVPSDVSEIQAIVGDELVTLLVTQKFASSKSDFRRLVEEGAIKIMSEKSEEKIDNVKYTVSQTIVLKIGKKKFVKIVV